MSPRQLIIDGKKKCCKCGELKRLDDFLKDKRTTTGKSGSCKQCIYSKRNHIYKTDAKVRENQKRLGWESHIRRAYDMTVDDYHQLLLDQNNSCRICKTPFDQTGTKYYAHIDHDHKTGTVRGLLCALCNVGLGSFKDSIETLYSAINYLRDNEE